jgi:hypothetical protein
MPGALLEAPDAAGSDGSGDRIHAPLLRVRSGSSRTSCSTRWKWRAREVGRGIDSGDFFVKSADAPCQSRTYLETAATITIQEEVVRELDSGSVVLRTRVHSPNPQIASRKLCRLRAAYCGPATPSSTLSLI